jgi:hypothetical protein
MLPRVQPIAPVLRAEPFDDPGWLFDLKYDGFRALCYLEQGRCRLILRSGNPMTRFAGLSDQIAASLDVTDAILDGEVADETGRPQFYDLLRATRTPAYVAFDVLWLNGADLRPLLLIERRRHLQAILPKGSAIISVSSPGEFSPNRAAEKPTFRYAGATHRVLPERGRSEPRPCWSHLSSDGSGEVLGGQVGGADRDIGAAPGGDDRLGDCPAHRSAPEHRRKIHRAWHRAADLRTAAAATDQAGAI